MQRTKIPAPLCPLLSAFVAGGREEGEATYKINAIIKRAARQEKASGKDFVYQVLRHS